VTLITYNNHDYLHTFIKEDMPGKEAVMDDLLLIKRIMDEHRLIRNNMKLVGESLNDREAASGLQKMREDMMVDVKSTAAEKQSKIEEALAVLEAGLKNHYAFEEEYLPPLLGELLMESLVLEHKQLLEKLGQVKSVIENVKLEKLSRNEQLNEEAVMFGLLNRIIREKEGHINREEAILEMLQKVLEEKARQPQREEHSIP
jgi:hypothetical protein